MKPENTKLGDIFYCVEYGYHVSSLPRLIKGRVRLCEISKTRADNNGDMLFMINQIYPIRLCGKTPEEAYGLLLAELQGMLMIVKEGEVYPFYDLTGDKEVKK